MKIKNPQFYSNLAFSTPTWARLSIQSFSSSKMAQNFFVTLLLLIIDEKTDA